MLPLTGYLQLPAPASTSSGSQQLRLCDQRVCKSDTAVDKVELLADVGPWLKKNPFATVSSSEQVTYSTQICVSIPTAFTLASALAHLWTHLHFDIPDPLPSQRSGESQRQRGRCASAEAPALLNAHRQCFQPELPVPPPPFNSPHITKSPLSTRRAVYSPPRPHSTFLPAPKIQQSPNSHICTLQVSV